MNYDVVDVREGPRERGSDLIVTVGDFLFPDEVRFRVDVQVFAYTDYVGVEALEAKLNQLVRGWEENALDYGVLLTTGEIREESRKLVLEHNSENRDRRVRLIDGRELAMQFLKYFPPLDE